MRKRKKEALGVFTTMSSNPEEKKTGSKHLAKQHRLCGFSINQILAIVGKNISSSE